MTMFTTSLNLGLLLARHFIHYDTVFLQDTLLQNYFTSKNLFKKIATFPGLLLILQYAIQIYSLFGH